MGDHSGGIISDGRTSGYLINSTFELPSGYEKVELESARGTILLRKTIKDVQSPRAPTNLSATEALEHNLIK